MDKLVFRNKEPQKIRTATEVCRNTIKRLGSPLKVSLASLCPYRGFPLRIPICLTCPCTLHVNR